MPSVSYKRGIFGGLTGYYGLVPEFNRRFDNIVGQNAAGIANVQGQFPGAGSRDFGNFGPPGGPGAPGGPLDSGGADAGALTPPPSSISPQVAGPQGLAPPPSATPGPTIGGGPRGPRAGGGLGGTPRRGTNTPSAGQSTGRLGGTNFGNRL